MRRGVPRRRDRPGGRGVVAGPGGVGERGGVGGRGGTMTGNEHADGEQHPIEAESYRIMRSRIDLSHLPPPSRAVTERVIHASADFDYATDRVCAEEPLAS